ncbi:transposase [Streptomyces coffeae]|uniref:transposase n=1 Tax=Streptomyces coffeae TaxID=621382 RepID=UPI001F28E2CA|nr:transposase [Streptomyces coffeae]
MNAIAERWIGSCRREATDRILITGQNHLRLIVNEYAEHYNRHWPHRSLGQRPPDPLITPEPGPVSDPTSVLPARSARWPHPRIQAGRIG